MEVFSRRETPFAGFLSKSAGNPDAQGFTMMTRLLASEELEVLLQEEVASEEESPFEEVLTLEEVPAFEEMLPVEEAASEDGPEEDSA